jgi:hypothetical protein
VPPVGDLCRVRESITHGLGVDGRPVPRDDLHPRVSGEPRLDDVGVSAGDDVDPAAGVRVDQDGRVDLPAPQCEVIDPQHTRHDQRW